jgi:hypothetical protein
MSISSLTAKHFKEVFFGGNWTVSNLEEQLKDLSWEESIQKVYNLNTIATLTFHIGYFVNTVVKVLEGGPLEGNDKFSFDHPEISSERDWEDLKSSVFDNVQRILPLIAAIPDEKLEQEFVNSKYGNYYRNIMGIVEHTHYHLGQIALIKKIIKRES